MTSRYLYLFKNEVNIASRKLVTTLPTPARFGLHLRRFSIVATSPDFTLDKNPEVTGFSVNAFASGLPATIAMNAQTARDMVALQSIFGVTSSLDHSKQSPKDQLRLQYLKDSEVVFLSVDLEAYEFAQEKITEVGVSILDSRDVFDTEAGPNGASWLSKINTRHFIIKEYRHLVNKRFVHGCPDKFDFGDSEVVSLSSIRDTLTGIFRDPAITKKPSDEGPRKLILVGHGLSNDTTFLKTLNFSPHAEGNILQSMDTQRLAGSTKRKTVALRRMLAGLLGAPPENLHNAGNDAAWTLRGLVMMVAKHTEEPDVYLDAISSVDLAPEAAKQRYKNARQAIQNRQKAERQSNAPKPNVPGPEVPTRQNNPKSQAQAQAPTSKSLEKPAKEPAKKPARKPVGQPIEIPVKLPVGQPSDKANEKLPAAAQEPDDATSKTGRDLVKPSAKASEENPKEEKAPRSRPPKTGKKPAKPAGPQLTKASAEEPGTSMAKTNGGSSEIKDEHKDKPAKRQRTGKGPNTNDKQPGIAKYVPDVRRQNPDGQQQGKSLTSELEHRTIGEHKQRRRARPRAPLQQRAPEAEKPQDDSSTRLF